MGDGKSLPLLLPQTHEDISAPVTCAVSLSEILFSYLQNDENRPHPPWVGSAGLVLRTDVLNPSGAPPPSFVPGFRPWGCYLLG